MSLRKIFANPFFLSLLLLCGFMATNRYIYGWDDQALEIPLLKHLIDPELYVGDYYVESLKENFSSYLYPILAKVITVDQIPHVYLALYILSRYFFFFFALKLWHTITGSTAVAFAATAMSFLIGRTEEFLYRTFSHQEFALAIIMAGLFMMYRNRVFLAAVLFGIAANFNALYALLPMLYLGTYLLLRWDWKRIFISGGCFTLSCLPFLWWMLPKKIAADPTDPSLYEGWMDVFLLSCPQNFLFQTTPLPEVFATWTNAFSHGGPYLFLICLYLFNIFLNPDFRRSRQSQAICLCGSGLLIVSFVFTYIFPSRLFIDLNLIRNMQYINFILMGYTTWWICNQALGERYDRAFLGTILMYFLSYRDGIGAIAIVGIIVLLFIGDWLSRRIGNGNIKKFQELALAVLMIASLIVLWKGLGWNGLKFRILASGIGLVTGIYVVTCLKSQISRTAIIRWTWIVTPLAAMAVYFGILHYNYVQITTKGGGFWQLQRNWEEMQEFVKLNTPKDALLMVPYNMEMGGFRIGSERSIIVSYRDCGIVGFDYPAVKEWEQRIADLKHFKVIPDGPLQQAIVNGLGKYQADYIVFTRFAAPRASNSTLTKMHENELFSLFRVNRPNRR